MVRVRWAAAAVAVAVLLLTGCAQREPGAETVQQVRIDLTDYTFRPGTVRTEVGTLVEITLLNPSRQMHELVLQTPEGDYELEVAPGRQVTFGVKFRMPGTYRFVCDLEGHLERGMAGQFVVEGEPGAVRWLGGPGEGHYGRGGHGDGGHGSHGDGHHGAGPAGAEPVSAVEIDLADYTFRPGRIAVAPGTLLEVTLTNSSGREHELVLNGGSVDFEAEVRPGERFAFGLKYRQPGTYPFVCELPGHSEQGMNGQIIVH